MNKFEQAKPVWLADTKEEKNVHLLFKAELDNIPKGTTLHITAADVYRVWYNGAFIGYGPARAAHGYARIDTWPLPAESGVLQIEVACYLVNNFCYPMQNGFLQAEVCCEKEVLAATGRAQDFVCARDPRWRQKVQRYSYQRTFIESVCPQQSATAFSVPAAVPEVALLDRRVSYPRFSILQPAQMAQKCAVTDTCATAPHFRQIDEISDTFFGFTTHELSHRPDVELLALSPVQKADSFAPFALPCRLEDHTCVTLRMDGEKTGLFRFSGHCDSAATLYVSFDEILTNGQVDFLRMQCSNVLTLTLAPGDFCFESMEPYSAQYIRLTVSGGNVSLHEICMREYATAAAERVSFTCPEETLNDVFEAAVETYRQNAPDLFMDCPSRERAGWLCDSFFLGRCEALLTAEHCVEHNFLENYSLGTFAFLPEGMLPMCYPANHNSGQFIPNWALWFIIELEEACTTRQLNTLAAPCLPLVEKLFAYFQQFRLKNGLLARLENWVFIEWSRTAEFMQDVNFPTNMLYAAALETAGRLYQKPEWQAEGQRLKKLIYELSFNGTFFVDNALLSGETLTVTDHTTECCQYYALYFGIADPQRDAEFFKRLCTQFGPLRKEAEVYPNVYRANAFIGNYLRLDILRRTGQYNKVLQECTDFFTKMAHATKTLWENDTPVASCNHGFAAYAANLILHSAGIDRVSPSEKALFLRSRSPLESFRCTLPLDGDSAAEIWCHNHEISATVPNGWQIVMLSDSHAAHPAQGAGYEAVCKG